MRPDREGDPLCLVELAAIIDEATSSVRHQLRNKLGSIRNASFYVKRRLSTSEAWAADPRLETMAALLDADVAEANALLGFVDERLHKRGPEEVDVRGCVRDAVEHARVEPSTRIEVTLDSATTRADPAELAVAARCLIENASEAMGGEGLVLVRGRIDGSSYWVEVVDHGPGIAETEGALDAFYTTKRGHVGLGLNVAQRIAQRYGGKVAIGWSSPTGASVSMVLPIAEARPHVDDPPR